MKSNKLSEIEDYMVQSQIYAIKDLNVNNLYESLWDLDEPLIFINPSDLGFNKASICIGPGGASIDIGNSFEIPEQITLKQKIEYGKAKFNSLKPSIYKCICCDMDIKETLEKMDSSETLTLASAIAAAVGMLIPVTGVLAIVTVLIAKKGIPKFCNESIIENGPCP